jgi:hypothetical protein
VASGSATPLWMVGCYLKPGVTPNAQSKAVSRYRLPPHSKGVAAKIIYSK